MSCCVIWRVPCVSVLKLRLSIWIQGSSRQSRNNLGFWALFLSIALCLYLQNCASETSICASCTFLVSHTWQGHQSDNCHHWKHHAIPGQGCSSAFISNRDSWGPQCCGQRGTNGETKSCQLFCVAHPPAVVREIHHPSIHPESRYSMAARWPCHRVVAVVAQEDCQVRVHICGPVVSGFILVPSKIEDS